MLRSLATHRARLVPAATRTLRAGCGRRLLCTPASYSDSEVAAYLKENLAKEGVVETPTGLQYRILASGPSEGPHPTASSPCVCHYKGGLVDGTEFDSSYGRGEPSTFAPNQVRRALGRPQYYLSLPLCHCRCRPGLPATSHSHSQPRPPSAFVQPASRACKQARMCGLAGHPVVGANGASLCHPPIHPFYTPNP
jgi:hypothetical protein